MDRNSLIFSIDGSATRTKRVSPYLFPQYVDANHLFLASDHELPTSLRLRFLPFDFGYNDPQLTISAYDTAYVSIPMENNFLATQMTGQGSVVGVTGATTVASVSGTLVGVNLNPNYLVIFQHTHQGKTRQWHNKAVTNVEGPGSGMEPSMFKHPVLIPAGDTLTCQVQNLANANLQVQIVLTGGEF